MITPVVGHVTCDLDQQRRVIEARRDGASRLAMARRTGGMRARVGALLGLRAESRPRGHAAPNLGSGAEDVWRSLRF